MNERIIELAQQCGYWSGQTIEMNDVGIAKFAQLIIQECADVLLGWREEPFPFDEELAVKLIKQHFGVES